MKVKIASVTRPGRLSGRITSQKICHLPAPSISAASSRARGRPSMNCRSRKVPKALKADGSTSPRNESISPKRTMIS